VTLASVLIALVPVVVFLAVLFFMDRFKLVRPDAVLTAIAWGAVAAGVSLWMNGLLLDVTNIPEGIVARYLAPPIEEAAKAVPLIIWLKRGRIGFLVDAAIVGFAVGTGFALVENVHYLSAMSGSLALWVVRGFGTALMHSGTTAILAMIARTLHNRSPVFRPALMLPGLLVAVVLHSLYNQFLVAPLLATALIVLVFPYIVMFLFKKSERETKSWLGTGFDTDQELLRVMRAGEVSDTPVGSYLKGLQTSFPPEVIVDMMCLLRLRAELGIRAKGILLMREAGFEADADPSLPAKLDEMRYLERSIGRTGMRALKPFIHTSTQDLWQLNLLDGTQ